jgi:hypothetical protein
MRRMARGMGARGDAETSGERKIVEKHLGQPPSNSPTVNVVPHREQFEL